MASDVASLVIEIDSKGVVKASGNLSKLQKQSGKTEKSTKSLTSANKRSSQSFVMLAVKVGAAMLAYRAITGVTRTFIENTIKQEQAMKQLEVAVRSTGGAAGFTAEELREMAQGLQQVTTFGDEALMEMQGILLTFTKIGKETLPQTTEAVANLAIRMGTDLKSAAIQLGKALNDPIANLSALSRSGIQFSKDQKQVVNSLVEAGEMAKAQKIILAELDVQFGGSARAARDTFGGALSSLNNTFGDLFEADGEVSTRLARVINQMNEGLRDVGFFEAAIRGASQAFDEAFIAGGESDVLATFREDLAEASVGAANLKRNLDAIITINKEGGIIEKALYGGPDKQAAAQELFDQKMLQMQSLQTAIDALARSEQSAIEAAAPEVAEDKAAMDSERRDEELAAIAEKEITAQQELNAALVLGQVMHNSNLAKIEQSRSKDRKKIEEGMWSNAIGLMHSGNKTMFDIGKTAAVAQALIKGKQSVVDSYEFGTRVGGPILGAAFAATAGAAVLGQISALKNTSFGGGGSVSTGTSATVPSAAPSGAAEVPTEAGETAARQEVSITLNGAGYSKENVRELIESINEEIGDGVEIMVTAQ